MQLLLAYEFAPMTVFLFIVILCFTLHPKPKNDFLLTLTFPPVITPGPVLEKSSKMLSWSIEDDVLIIQCFPIMLPVLIIEPDTTNFHLLFLLFPILLNF